MDNKLQRALHDRKELRAEIEAQKAVFYLQHPELKEQ